MTKKLTLLSENNFESEILNLMNLDDEFVKSMKVNLHVDSEHIVACLYVFQKWFFYFLILSKNIHFPIDLYINLLKKYAHFLNVKKARSVYWLKGIFQCVLVILNVEYNFIFDRTKFNATLVYIFLNGL